MCRNITELRGLDPPVTREELEAAARQFLRKVTGLRKPGPEMDERMATATAEVADVTARLLREMPPRRQPPSTLPPLRRAEVRARLGLALQGRDGRSSPPARVSRS